MPIWAVLVDSRMWFSSSKASRKARNLIGNPSCSLATDNPLEPVVVEGSAELVVDDPILAAVLAEENAKYHTHYGPEVLDPEVNSWFALQFEHVFGLTSADFTGSPTKWSFTI